LLPDLIPVSRQWVTLLCTRPAVTFPAHRRLAVTKFYCLVTEARMWTRVAT